MINKQQSDHAVNSNDMKEHSALTFRVGEADGSREYRDPERGSPRLPRCNTHNTTPEKSGFVNTC